MTSESQPPQIFSLLPLREVSDSVPPQVRMRLCELFPILLDALDNDRTWLEDFAEEEIAVSADLHDVIQAYRSFFRRAA